jgi:hypothetical protein
VLRRLFDDAAGSFAKRPLKMRTRPTDARFAWRPEFLDGVTETRDGEGILKR